MKYSDFLVLYTDGSGTSEGSPGGWAAVLLAGITSHSHDRFSGRYQSGTNQTMELAAIMHGLHRCPMNTCIQVRTDSESAIRWLDGTNRVHDPRIRYLVETTMRVIGERRLSVGYRHVRGHQGIYFQEECDVMASKARTGNGTYHSLSVETLIDWQCNSCLVHVKRGIKPATDTRSMLWCPKCTRQSVSYGVMQ